MKLDDFFTTFLELGAYAPTTSYNYSLRYNKHLKPVFGSRDIESLTKKEVQLWALTTPKANLTLLSSIIGRVVEYDLIDKNVCHRIKQPKHTSYRRSYVPLSDIEARTDVYREPLLFVAKHGLRASEAFVLDSRDIAEAEDTGLLTIHKNIYGSYTKSGKVRQVPYVHDYVKLPKSRQFRESLHPATFHSLRKTYAAWLVDNGIHVTVIQRLLGHSAIQTTMLYIEGQGNEALKVREVLL